MGGRELDIEGGSSAPSPFAVLDPVRVLCAQGQGNAPPRPPPGLPPYRGVSSRRAAFMLRSLRRNSRPTASWGSCKPSQSLVVCGRIQRWSRPSRCRRLSELLPRTDALPFSVPKVKGRRVPLGAANNHRCFTNSLGRFPGPEAVDHPCHARPGRARPAAIQDVGTPRPGRQPVAARRAGPAFGGTRPLGT